MRKIASSLFDTISDFSKEHPGAVTGLLAGGGLGALGGAVFTGDGDEDEPTSKKVKRKLKNALIGGLAGSAAGGSLGYALGSSGPLAAPLPADDVSPESEAFHSPTVRAGLAAVGAGAGMRADRSIRKGNAADVDKLLSGNKRTSNLAGNKQAIQATLDNITQTKPSKKHPAPSTVNLNGEARSLIHGTAAANGLTNKQVINMFENAGYNVPAKLKASMLANKGVNVGQGSMKFMDALGSNLASSTASAWSPAKYLKATRDALRSTGTHLGGTTGGGKEGLKLLLKDMAKVTGTKAKQLGKGALRNKYVLGGATLGATIPDIADLVGNPFEGSDVTLPLS